MKLDKPPYAIIESQSPESVAHDMVQAFARMAALPSCIGHVFGALVDQLGIDPRDPVAVAGTLLAADIDSGGGGGHHNAYHNVRHFGEVMLGAYYLSRLQRLPAQAASEVVLAALMHDYGHDGQRNGDVPFRLERLAVDTTAALLADAGMPAAQRQRLAALVLSTEVSQGHPYALACHARHLSSEAGAPVQPPLQAPELALLSTDASAARQALLLCEADVLPSVGLTSGHALKIQAELAVEWDAVLDAQDKLRFIDMWLKRTVMSLFFVPNALKLRERLASMSAKNAAAEKAGLA